MDTEEPSDFKSLRERFQSACRTNSLPVYINPTEEKPILPPKISRIRFNPALQGVISSLENQVPVAAPLIAPKPELLPRPELLPKPELLPRPELLPKPEIPPKPNDLSKDAFLVKTNDMRLSKVFRKTLSIMDSTRTGDVGMCTNHPQVYRQSIPVFQDPPLEANQPQTQEVYEDVISAEPPPTPINDLKITGTKPLPATEGVNPMKMTTTPAPDDNSAEDKKEKEMHKVPSLKTLPSIASLGPPPSKPPRPPNVDLSAFFTGSSQQNGASNEPEESPEVEYELPNPSSASEDGDFYDVAFTPEGSTESDSNVYEVEANDCENPESVNPAPEDSRSPESLDQLWDTRKRICAELITRRQSQVLDPQGPSASEDDDFYDVAFTPEGSTESDSNVYEVDANDCDNPECVNPAPDASSLKESDESLCYEDILKLRESLSDRDVYDTDPVSSLETAYEVSVSNNERSNKSSVSEGYYSADTDNFNESFQKNEVKIRKKEQTFRKKFKILGQENMLYASVIIDDFKPEKHLLPVKKGDMVEVIRITDCPAGKWLARDVQGNYGFVPVASLQVFHEIEKFSNQHLVILPTDPDVYADVEVRPKDSGARKDSLKGPDSYSAHSDNQYDDISNMSQTSNSSGGKGKVFGHLFRKDKFKKQDAGLAPVFPNMNRTTSQEGEDNHSHTYVISDQYERAKEEKTPGWKAVFHKNKEQKGTEKPSTSATSGLKKIAKEEKIFREKFKYTGEINVINIAIINDLALPSPKHKLEIAVKPGETVEVIDITSEDQIICRNFAGKYGYVPIEYLNFSLEN